MAPGRSGTVEPLLTIDFVPQRILAWSVVVFCSCASVALHRGTAFGSNFAFFGKLTFVLMALGGCSGLADRCAFGSVRIST